MKFHEFISLMSMAALAKSTIVRRSLYGVLLSTETSGETTFSSYDAFARVAQTWRAAVSAATGTTGVSPVAFYTYSPAGDLLATHTYTNNTDILTETYAYDMLGNRISTTDAHGNTTYRAYDPLGNLTAEWGATYPVRYTYDTQGRRTSLSTTRDGTTWDTTTWTYDPYTSLCVSKTYADGSTVTYTYTPDNLPLRTTYASGKWKENVYNAQRRLCGVIYSSPDMDYELQLDEYGNATNVQDAAGNSWRYEYGFDSQLLSEEYITTGGTRSCASASTNGLSRSYDSFDRPIGYTLTVNDEPKGGIGYAYDNDGDLTRIAATNSAGRSFAVAYTNNTGYNYGYTLTTPSGNTIRRVVDRDDCRRSLVTNCATYFNSSLVDSNLYAFDALSRPVARTTGTTGVSPVDSTFAYNNRSEVVSAAIGIPEVSAQTRRYVPMDFIDDSVICTNKIQMIPDATLYHLGVLTSQMHMAWMRAVCGRMKSDYSYSKDIVYNNFIWPRPSNEMMVKITEAAQAILDIRKRYMDVDERCSLAVLYDPTAMPPDLVKAHAHLDALVDKAYGLSPSVTDADRVAHLFKLYAEKVDETK